MKILITGNMGYIGPAVVKRLRQSYPEATLIGLDIGYFGHCLLNAHLLPECYLDQQVYGDVRLVSKEFFHGIHAVVHLAAISNDPMGKSFEEATFSINHKGTIHLAQKAKEAGVRSFVFASSCSVYGFAEEGARTETSELNPLTAYAKSKVLSERDLAALGSQNFKVTCLRFATACGMSERLRLDLVVNDFVAGAVVQKRVMVLSDGSPWRPLINTQDMARAIDWAIQRDPREGGDFLIINVGSNEWNYQVRDLAEAVARVVPNIEVLINKDAPPDKRSYRVSYDLFKKLAPRYQPQINLSDTIRELKEGFEQSGFNIPNYRESSFIRLNVLMDLRKKGLLTSSLEWSFKKREEAV
jgi:nucleoside-diphosphate-sugar epimerase